MRITRLTPDQARALGEARAHATAILRQMITAFQRLACQAVEALRQVASSFHVARPLPAGRPAWQSPYGPPPRRQR
ncbi:hypothetical protein [Streptomyces sp. bgisy034]|uniref:hypothetical protein n=1 Tax=Streptomyces sp. bgisy034 TaxID=3413774 RepID=UPI003EBD207E